MKYMNKFIAIGLGLGLAFTGTNFIEGIFTDSVTQPNVIRLAEAKVEEDLPKITGDIAYFTGKDGSDKFDQLIIPISIEQNDNVELIVSGMQEEGYTAELKDGYILVEPKSGEFDVKESIAVEMKVYINGGLSIYKIFSINKNNENNSCHNESHIGHTRQCQPVKLNIIDGKMELPEISNDELPEGNLPTEGEDKPPQDLETPDTEVNPEDDVDKPQVPDEAPKDEVTPEVPDMNPELKPEEPKEPVLKPNLPIVSPEGGATTLPL